MNGKIVFFLLIFSLLRTKGETPNESLLTDKHRRIIFFDEYIEILFSLPFLCVFLFPSFYIFRFFLTFRLAHRLLFPSYSKQELLFLSLFPSSRLLFLNWCFFIYFLCCVSRLGKIRCNLTFFLSGFPSFVFVNL